MKSDASLSTRELHAGLSLSCVLFLRMLALFLLLPVIALAAGGFAGAGPLSVGIAFGIYGLTQALMQIPLGALSDRCGRKPVIILGLAIFCIGSIVAATANSITVLIMGRALQGAGAVASTIMALAADLSRPAQRTRIMALLGISVGLAFGLAFLIGPGLYALVGIGTLFFLCAGLAAVAAVALLVLVPMPERGPPPRPTGVEWGSLPQILSTPPLARLILCGFISHLILMANFTAFPLLLQDDLGLSAAMHWQFYLPMLLTSLAGTGALLVFAERTGQVRQTVVLCMVGYLVAEAGLGLWASGPVGYLSIFCLTALFFAGFNYLEAQIPAELSRRAEERHRGSVLGVYATAQFLGLFCGGLGGGSLQGLAGSEAVFIGCAALSLLCWRLVAK